MQKTLTITPSRCTACKTCELACSFKHSNGSAPGIPRIKAHLFSESAGENLVVTCFQCDEAACVEVCPVDALARNEASGAIQVDERRCIGCRLCSIACPFGHMQHERECGTAVKCDLCREDEPACATFCPTKTLEYV